MNRLLFFGAVALGLAIAYLDSRPTWDDTGITAFALLVSAGLLAIIAPKRPWMWVLAVGIWIPAHAILRRHSLGSLGMLAVLAFPFAGAYAGMAARRMLR
jgi:hypothetical protein